MVDLRRTEKTEVTQRLILEAKHPWLLKINKIPTPTPKTPAKTEKLNLAKKNFIL